LATVSGQEFVIDGDRASAPRRVATALQPRFTVVKDAPRHARQVWLDTFDWRLHAAGLVLRQVSSARGGELLLTTSAGDALAAQPLVSPVTPGILNGSGPAAPRWPALLGAIPAGPLRERLDPVVEIRALLPLAQVAGTLTQLRVLDGERKTVARITLEAATLAGPGGAALPPRLTLTPVRGYQADTDRAARLLRAAGDFTPDPGPAFVDVLTAAGRHPGDYTDQVDVALTAAMPARAALATILLRVAGVIEANVGFVLRDVDTEFLHDLRVAVRRTRSALKLAGDVLPDGLAARFAPEFSWLGDLTTPVRDLDVYLTGFDEIAAGLHAAVPGDLERVRDHLMKRRVSERRKLVRGLRSARFTTLMADWRTALAPATTTARTRRKKPAAAMDVGSLAGDRIAHAYRRVAKRGAAVAAYAPDLPPAEAMHALRKRGKELRYLLEFFATLYDPVAHRRAVKDLKGLQDCLGAFQDAEVQRAEMREFAAQMLAQPGADLPSGVFPAKKVPSGVIPVSKAEAQELAATLLAMGELTAQLHVQQVRAQAEVADRFAEFARADILRKLGIASPAGGK
jgi:CHAD domain-containing protein